MSVKINSPQINSIYHRTETFEPSNSNPNLKVLDSISNKNDEEVNHVQKKKQDLFASEQSINDDYYYSEEFENIMDYNTGFNVKIFIEMTFYHFLYFMVLGPFTSLLIFFIYRDFTLARNLGFYGLNANFITQTIVFLINFVGLFGYVYLRVEEIYIIEIIGLFGGCMCRSMVVAIKYALFPEKKINYVKHKILTDKQISSELFAMWYKQEDNIVEKELTSTITRNSIDENLFLFYFLRPLKLGLIDNINKKVRSLDYQPNQEENRKVLDEVHSKKLEFFYGYPIARYLLKRNIKHIIPIWKLFLLSALLSMVRSLLPVVYRVAQGKSSFGNDSLSKFIVACIFLGTFYFYMLNFTFIIIGAFEYERPIQILSQLSNFLSWEKVEEHHAKKIFPSINLFCVISFRSWYTLNKVLRDYGSKYLKRADMYLGLFLTYYLIGLLVCLVSIFEVIPKVDILNYGVWGLETFIALYTVFYLIYKGIIINDHYSIHCRLLNELRQILIDFKVFDMIYFDNKNYISQNEVYTLGKDIVEDIACDMTRENHKNKKENRDHYIENLIAINEYIVKQLDFQKNTDPFSVLGIPATAATFQSLLAAIGSVLTVSLNKLTKI